MSENFSDQTLAVEGHIKGAAVYNPHLWSDGDLKSVFVVRRKELAELTRALSGTSYKKVPQHILLVGHRGLGKTTILRRLALEARDSGAIAVNWLPLGFPEEQYTVSNLYELWRNVLDALLDRLEEMGAPYDERLELETQAQALESLKTLEEREEAAIRLLRRTIKERKQGLLLLIDSTDQIMAGLAETEADALWRLRGVLSHEPGLFWIGSSYQALEAENQYQDAFHDFFNYLHLRSLTLDEMRRALLALARTFGMGPEPAGEGAEKRMEKTLRDNPERLTALKKMTGGNPRTTVILYELFSSGQNRDIQGDLNSLLDMMTPLYKSRMENLKEQPRKILAHLMEGWAPQSAAQVSLTSGLPVTTVSSQLSRLENWGLVEKVSLPGHKKNSYQAGERFFNVWYLMRFASRRLRRRFQWLVEFMGAWYSQAELCDLAGSFSAGLLSRGRLEAPGNLEFYRAVSMALPEGNPERMRLEWQLYCRADDFESRSRRPVKSELFDFQSKEDRPFADADDYRRRLKALKSLLAQCPHAVDDPWAWVELVMGSLGLSLQRKEEVAALAAGCAEAEFESLKDDLERDTGRVRKSYESATYELIRQAVLSGDFFPDCPWPEIAFGQICHAFSSSPAAMASVIFNLAEDLGDWLEKCCLELRKIAADNSEAWFILGVISEQYLNDHEQADADYRMALSLEEKGNYWFRLGNLLSESPDKYGEAEKAYHRTIALGYETTHAWFNLGNLLALKLNRYGEAEEAYRQSLAIYPENGPALVNLGNLLQYEFQRYEEAERVYDKAVDIMKGEVRVWYQLGNLLRNHLGRYEEAQEAYLKAVEVGPEYAPAWHGLGLLLHYHAGQYEESEEAFRKAVALDRENDVVWNDLGNLLQALKRYEEAETAYRRAIAVNDENFGFWFNLAEVLQYGLQRYEESEKAYRRSISLEPGYAAARYGLGNLLRSAFKRYQEAEEEYRRALAIDDQDAAAWNNLGALLHYELRKYEEAEKAYRRAVSLDESSPGCLFNLGNLLQDYLGRYEEAEDVYQRALSLNKEDDLPWFGLGRLWRDHLKNYEKSEQAFLTAVSLDEKHPYYRLGLGLLYLDALARPGDAEKVFREAVELDPHDYCLVVNLARCLFINGDLPAAGKQYRTALDLAENNKQEGLPEINEVLLQSNLFLKNYGEAGQALQYLASEAVKGNQPAFFCLRSQVCECCSLGLGPDLVRLMEAGDNPYADFLQPFSLALKALEAGNKDPLKAAPPEIASVAEDIFEAMPRRPGAGQ